jgi:hypothetical protein
LLATPSTNTGASPLLFMGWGMWGTQGVALLLVGLSPRRSRPRERGVGRAVPRWPGHVEATAARHGDWSQASLEAAVDGVGIHLQADARRADPTLIESHHLGAVARDQPRANANVSQPQPAERIDASAR